MREPITRQLVALKIPGENHLFRLFVRNGWRPEGQQARQLADELSADHVNEIAEHIRR
jgi:hypothetical protein